MPKTKEAGLPASSFVPLCEWHGSSCPSAYFRLSSRWLVRGAKQLIRKYRLKSPRFILIMQHHNGYHAHRLPARPAVGNLALQVLQKPIRKMILRALTPGIFLASRAAVRTDVLDLVLLLIAVQSRPAGAAHAQHLRVSPFHGLRLLQIHVHKT